MDLNPSLVQEVEAYMVRNAGRDPATVKREVFAILDSVFVRRDAIAGDFQPAPATLVTLSDSPDSVTGN